MFPKNAKSHKMNTRNNELYEVYHANTGRFQDSSIIYMQNLLNEDEQKRNQNNLGMKTFFLGEFFDMF